MRSAAKTQVEIAALLCIGERTVRRVLAKLKSPPATFNINSSLIRPGTIARAPALATTDL
jgi:hypothetical protein